MRITQDRLVECQLQALGDLAAVRVVVRLSDSDVDPEDFADRVYAMPRIVDSVRELLAAKDDRIAALELAMEREAAE